MILLIDADSIVWASCYKKKESPECDGLHTLEDAKEKLNEVLMSIVNDIEADHDVTGVKIFAGSVGNFRKQISKTYKADRKDSDRPAILNDMFAYIKFQYDVISGVGVETDDVLATYWKQITDVVGKKGAMIVSIDKDYKQLPALIYDYHYKKKCYYDISEQEARYNFYEQMICGDAGDNVKVCKGYGPAYCKKAFKDCLSHYSYLKVSFALYRKIYGNKARERFIETRQLLTLKTEI